jgi:C-terminal processing protease CtpA/Prc
MTKYYLSLCALCVSGAVLLSQTASAQVAPGQPGGKDKSAPKAKGNPASKPGDARRETRKPAVPDNTKDTRDTAKDRAKDAKDTAKDRTKDARDTAKDTAKDARDTAKDRTKDARDTAKDAKDDVKDRAKDARDTAKDTRDDVKDRAKDARDTAKDRTKDARDTAKDTRDDVKDRAKDARDTAKDRTKDARDTAKDTRDDAKDRAKDGRDTKDVARDSKDSGKQARKFDTEKVKTSDLGLSLKDSDDGITISNVEKNSVFVDSGFRSGDQIVSINGRNISRQSDFVSYLFAPDVVSVGRVPVVVMRNGVRDTIYIEPRTIIRNYETVTYSDRRNPVREFGLVVDGRDDDRVYVERVIKGSRAEHAGIQVDDLILAINEQPVETPRDLGRLLEKYEGERIDMEIDRDRQAKVIEVNVLR